jgi:hypothetical protein
MKKAGGKFVNAVIDKLDTIDMKFDFGINIDFNFSNMGTQIGN